ncbi:MAG TPA: biotin transporter BioY [Candidatus Poseidoniaceae archaeon]|nr:MAG TPA: biotin transporter BioY [Candidatus Poseidoniales archaeon]HII11893.1 biotin transporter BioY [Candidatus Poseidoniaceae archaeon]|tara:strand:+ start:183 stop:800 length:618 start_codon:yes stop_codon:yes gene_type:complete
MLNPQLLVNPLHWHLAFRDQNTNLNERAVGVVLFAGLTALCAQISFLTPISPVPFTMQTFAVLATGVYLRRNDAFMSGALYLGIGALGAPVFADGGHELFSGGALIASGGYLLAFPFASAIVAEGLDRSYKAGIADLPAQLMCWSIAMVPVYAVGTLWLAEAYNVSVSQAYAWGTEPFLIWDFGKIIIMCLVTSKLWKYSPPTQE